MKDARKLEALAVELKLTPFQRRFAEVLASDPERNQTRAVVLAREALGLKPCKKASAEVEGTRSLRNAKVQNYLQALTDHAKEAIVRSGGTILTLQQNLTALSDMAQGRIATETRTYTEKDGQGKKVVRAVNRFERAKAHEMLLKHHTGTYARENAPPPPPPTNVTLNFAVLSLEELRALREIRQRLLNPAPEEKESA